MKWQSMSDDEKNRAAEYAFENATEIDHYRFSRICHWHETHADDEPLFMNIPDWVMSIYERARP